VVAERRRVLIVEDDAVVRAVLVESLRFEGYEVRAAADGAAALAVLGQWIPNLILLDLMMPGMDGWAFRDQQRALASVREVPVVVVSASRELSRAAEALHPAAVVPKPFDLDALLATVEQCAAASPER
jgi:two-component system chemotaxis response regulator CheY